RHRLCQILLGDGGGEPVVVGDESADELVQPVLEYLLHAAVLEPRADRTREPLRRSLPAVGARHLIEVAHHVVVAAGERARHLRVEDQEIGDQPRLETLAIDPMIGGERRYRAQDRGPLEIIERAADMLLGWKQQVVLHVENARRVVGALDEYAETGE